MSLSSVARVCGVAYCSDVNADKAIKPWTSRITSTSTKVQRYYFSSPKCLAALEGALGGKPILIYYLGRTLWRWKWWNVLSRCRKARFRDWTWVKMVSVMGVNETTSHESCDMTTQEIALRFVRCGRSLNRMDNAFVAWTTFKGARVHLIWKQFTQTSPGYGAYKIVHSFPWNHKYQFTLPPGKWRCPRFYLIFISFSFSNQIYFPAKRRKTTF